MNFFKQTTWLLSVIFYNLRLITEDLLLDPALRKLTWLKALTISQKDRYESNQLAKATTFEIETFAN